MTKNKDEIKDPCSLCDLNDRSQFVPSSGNINSPLAFIGEAPGAEEVNRQEPFVGTAGRLLSEILNETGISRNKIWIGNSCSCRPPENRQPTTKELKLCYQKHLAKELSEIKSKVVILLGAIALKAVLKKTGITKHRGRVYEQDEKIFIPTFHPASALEHRDPNNRKLIKNDILLAKELLRSKGKITKRKLDWKICNSFQSIKEVRDEIIKQKSFSFDLETTGLDFLSDDILGLSFSWKESQAVFIPFKHKESFLVNKGRVNLKDLNRVKSYLQEILNCQAEKIAHNGKFDVMFLRTQGLEVKRFSFDTMLAAYLLNETQGTHGLKYLANFYLKAHNYDVELENYFNDENAYGDAPLSILAEYACYDAEITFVLRRVLQPLLEEEKLYDVHQKHIMPIQKFLTEVQYKGIKVDVDYLDKLEKEFSERIAQNERAIKDDPLIKLTFSKLGKELNLQSPKQVAYLLYDVLKLSFPEKDEADNDWEDEPSLTGYLTLVKHFENTSDEKIKKLLTSFIDFRRDTKILKTYINGTKKFIKRDGRLHTDFSMTGTVTGRLSSSKPALQNLPAHDHNRGFLNVFVPSTSDMTLVYTDYSQAELRFAAVYSQDEAYIKAFQEKQDLHTVAFCLLYNKKKEEETFDIRKIVKTINFGFLYGRSLKSIAKSFKQTDEWAEDIMERVFGAFSGLMKWRDSITEEVQETGRVVSYYGRVRHLPAAMIEGRSSIKNQALRQALNAPIQSATSDLNLKSAIKTSYLAKKVDIKFNCLCFVHDSVLYEVERTKVSEFVKILKNTGEVTIKNVPFTIDVKIGDRWGSVEDYDKIIKRQEATKGLTRRINSKLLKN